MIAVFTCSPSLVISERPCNRCNQTLPIASFATWKRKDGVITVKSFCKKCVRESTTERRQKNLAEHNKKSRDYYRQMTPEQLAAKRLRERLNPKKKIYASEYRKKNRGKVNGYANAYHARKRSDPEWKKTQAAYAKRRRSENLNVKIKHYCRVRIRSAIMRASQKKTLTLNQLTGCQDSLLAFYVLNGREYKKGLHIDHYIPCNHFDLTNESEQRVCFNWRNLRVIGAFDNISKHAKLPDNYREVESEIRKTLSLDSASL